MNFFSNLHWTTALAIAMDFVSSPCSAEAAVPATMTHQGRLFDANNVPITATINVVFALYDSEDPNATPLWTETRSVPFENGYFSVSLGDSTPLGPSVFDGSVRYLGITIGTDDELSPRSPTRSVP
ncbi:MAG TPA: collagen-like protein, partial [Polyangium sp.]|nr:collagen-like protein [Polyangium sp.]